MAELIPLGVEVAPVLRRSGATSIGTCSTTVSPKPSMPVELPRVVREDADRGQPEVGEDLVADAVVARVGREAELDVRLDRVEALLLQLVGAELVQQPDPAPLLGHVEEHAAALARDLRERLLELLAAVAAQRVEDVAGEALGVRRARARPRRRRPRPRTSATCCLPVSFSRNATALNSPYSVGSRTETTRSTSFSRRRRYSMRSATVIILMPCRSQNATRSGTRAIVPSSFMISQTTPAGLRPARRARSTAASVWPPRGARRRPRAQREDVAGLDEVVGRRGGIDRDLDRARRGRPRRCRW